MKKIASVAAIALFAVAFTSCKKDYTCECTSKDNTGTVMSTSTVSIKATKKDAKTACNEESTVSGGGSSITMSCSLK